jgi:hypothetical protein
MTNVFISYRRDDAGGHAGRLSDRLIARFGAERVFMDVQDIQPGQNFEQAIEQTLARCDHMLAVIGPRWLADLQARAASREDFVRSEIGTALARGMAVIPVLVGGAKMPAGDELPAELSAFSRCQAAEIRDDCFDEDAARLVGFLAGGSGAAGPHLFGRRVTRRALAWSLPAVALALVGAWMVWPEPAPEPAADAAVEPSAAPARGLPTLSYGTWTLRNARDEEGKNWSNSVLQFTSQEETPDGLNLRGRFTWRLNNVLMGTEEISGRYVERTRQVILEGSTVTDAPHEGSERLLAVGSYSAVLSADERTLVQGRWGSTAQNEPGVNGEWDAVR